MRRHTQGGFSLTELMIAVALSGTLLAGVYSTFIQQRRIGTQQEQLTEVRQLARVTMDSIVEEFREAGFDPGGLADAQLPTDMREVHATRLRFTRDLNCNGTLSNSSVVPQDTSNEDIAYFFDAPERTLRRLPYIDGAASGGGAQPVASNILMFQLCYFVSTDALGQCTVAPRALDIPNIRAVQVTLTAHAAKADPTYNDPDPNQPTAYKHYRKATLTSIVRFRNLDVKRGGTATTPPVPVQFNQSCAL